MLRQVQAHLMSHDRQVYGIKRLPSASRRSHMPVAETVSNWRPQQRSRDTLLERRLPVKTFQVKLEIRSEIRDGTGEKYAQTFQLKDVLAPSRKSAEELARLLYEGENCRVVAVSDGKAMIDRTKLNSPSMLATAWFEFGERFSQ